MRTRRLRRPLVASALALAVALPAVALAAPEPGPAVQQVSGSIAVPNPTKSAPVVVTRHSRTAGLLSKDTNGLVGWFFEVDQSTWGGQFALTTKTAGADLDIIFYSNPGTVADAPAEAAAFSGTEGDGEAGLVPASATHALVYAAGAPNADFAYVGHAPVQVVLDSGVLDVQVPVGGAVTFVNPTAEEVVVNGGSAFTVTVPAGGQTSKTFGKVGSFPYSTPLGTGTVTVVR